jgi:aldehyde dehydrogenase (NAD+)
MFETQQVLQKFNIASVQAGAHSRIGGWSKVEGRRAFEAVNPADGSVTARVAGATKDDYRNIIDSATISHKTWRMVPPPRRGELVARIGDLVAENLEELAAIVALDTGKSMMEAKGELREVIDMAAMAAGQSRMLYGFTQQSQRAKHRMYDQWLPLGVVGVISAYNFPAAVWAQNGFLAAIGGNAVIWKPSPKVPLTAIALQHLTNIAMQELKFEGVFSLYIPEDNETAELLVADPRVALISFTGSSAVGRKVANIVGSTLGRRYLLECSGNNGCIVDETADLKLAARSITFGAVGTTGQRCTSTRRVIAHRSVESSLVDLLKRSFDQIKIGDPRDADTVVGRSRRRRPLRRYDQGSREAWWKGRIRRQTH